MRSTTAKLTFTSLRSVPLENTTIMRIFELVIPGGGGGHSTKFYAGRFLRNPLKYLDESAIPFLMKKVPLSYTFHRKL